ncbi:MAG TPA: TolC family protein [Daejeonella sp.]|nr:TolC family protein [Daejeonella sp.]
MQKAKHLLFIIFFIKVISPLSAQTTQQLPVNLQDLFELANQSNRTLKVLTYHEKIATEAINQEKQKQLPSLDVAISAGYNGDVWISDRNFSNGMKVPIPDFGNNFALEATQIIYAGGVIKTSIKIAELSHVISQLDTDINKQDIRFAIAGYYLELLKLNNQKKILQKNLEQTNKLLAQIKAKYKQGTSLRNNTTRYELQLQSLELALQKTENRRTIINNELVKTLLLPKETKLELKDVLPETSDTLTNETNWQILAQQNSAVLQKIQPKLEQAKHHEKLIKADELPQVFAYGGNYLNGPIMIEIPALDKNFNYWSVGLGIKYNMASLYKNKTKGNIARLKTQSVLESNEIVKDELSNQISSAYILYNEAKNVYQTQLKGVELATENYTIIKNRYLNDLVLITEMLDAENAKVNAELKAANAQINILFQYYQLKKLTGTL